MAVGPEYSIQVRRGWRLKIASLLCPLVARIGGAGALERLVQWGANGIRYRVGLGRWKAMGVEVTVTEGE